MTGEDLPRKGDILAGKYEVEDVLGAGGMGVVVAARHTALRQRVAIKFLLPAALKLPDSAARFLREAQAAVAIQSEHVARVLDVGTLEGGLPFMVMEHLSGTDLARRLKERGPLPLEDAVDFILQASEALAEAHAIGIVHRDLKPANLFLTRRAEGSPLVKVLDFGLSKMALAEGGASEGLTATNVVAGSPHYMSPEQVRSLKHVDARTDVWSLGVILWELLTAKRPFEGHTATAICAAIVADSPPLLRTVRMDVPEGIEALVAACLEKDPGRRIPTVAHLAAGLAPFAPKRSEQSVERIRRLLPEAAASADAIDGAVTLPWQGGARDGAVPTSPSGSSAGSDSAPRESRSSGGGMSGAPEPSTGPVGWGGTQSLSMARRRTLVVVAVALAALLIATALVINGRDKRLNASSDHSAAAVPEQPPTPLPGPVISAAPVATAESSAAPSATPSATASAATSTRPKAKPPASAGATAPGAPPVQSGDPQVASSVVPTAAPTTNPLDIKD